VTPKSNISKRRVVKGKQKGQGVRDEPQFWQTKRSEKKDKKGGLEEGCFGGMSLKLKFGCYLEKTGERGGPISLHREPGKTEERANLIL